MTADQRNLRNHALDATIDGANHQYVAAAVAGAPDTDPLRVGFGEGFGVGDSVTVIAHLLPRIDLLTRFAVTASEVPIIEDERREPCVCERLGKPIEIHLLHCREAVRHHDGW